MASSCDVIKSYDYDLMIRPKFRTANVTMFSIDLQGKKEMETWWLLGETTSDVLEMDNISYALWHARLEAEREAERQREAERENNADRWNKV